MAVQIERTVVILKPDALARGLVGEVVSRLERKGLKIVACSMRRLDEETLREHYSHLVTKPFFGRILEFMSSLPVIVQCWEGPDAVGVVRRLAGATDGRLAIPGTIRGDLASSVQCNLIHASDSHESAQAEIDRFFTRGDLLAYSVPQQGFLFANDELHG